MRAVDAAMAAASKRKTTSGRSRATRTRPRGRKPRSPESHKIGKLVRQGVPHKRAVAMALAMRDAGRLGPRGGYTRASRRRRGNVGSRSGGRQRASRNKSDRRPKPSKRASRKSRPTASKKRLRKVPKRGYKKRLWEAFGTRAWYSTDPGNDDFDSMEPDLLKWREYKQGATLAKRAIAQPSQYDRIFDGLFAAGVVTYEDVVKQFVKVGGFVEEYTRRQIDLGRLSDLSTQDLKQELKEYRALKEDIRR